MRLFFVCFQARGGKTLKQGRFGETLRFQPGFIYRIVCIEIVVDSITGIFDKFVIL